MKVRVYMVTDNLPDGDPMYAMLVVFEARWAKPFHRFSFQDGTTVISEHVDRAQAAEHLRFWRANPDLKVTVTR